MTETHGHEYECQTRTLYEGHLRVICDPHEKNVVTSEPWRIIQSNCIRIV